MKPIKDILKVDKDVYKKTVMYNVAFFAFFYLISLLFSRVLQMTSSGLTQLNMTNTDELSAAIGQVTNAVWMTVALVIIFFIMHAYNFAVFENLIWNSIFPRKTTFKNTSKFLGFSILLGLILAVLAGLIFYIVAKLPSSVMVIGVTVFYVAVLFAFYMLQIGFISFGRNQEIMSSIKNAFKIGLGRLDVTVFPLIVITLMGVAVNLVLLLFNSFPETIVVTLQTLAFSAYGAWFKMYLANALKPVKL